MRRLPASSGLCTVLHAVPPIMLQPLYQEFTNKGFLRASLVLYRDRGCLAPIGFCRFTQVSPPAEERGEFFNADHSRGQYSTVIGRNADQ